MNARCDTVSGELHAIFMDNSPSGSHALPLIAPPVAPPVAQPAARQRPGTVAGHGRYRRRKQPAQAHGDGTRDHTQARDDTTTSNTDFPASTSRKVTTKPTRLVLQHRFSRTSKPKSHHKTNTLCPSSTLVPTTSNTDFSAPTRRKVTTQPTRFANPPRRHPPPPTPTFQH